MQRTTTASRTILTTFLTILAMALLGGGLAQIELTEFQSGTPIVADEMNANFDELETAVEAVAHGSVHVSPLDLAPLGGVTDYVVHGSKSTLYLTGSETFSCFGANVDLPHGAELTRVQATVDDPDGSASTSTAEVAFGYRPWTEEPSDYYATLDQYGSTTGYVTQGVSGPFIDAAAQAVDNDAYEYKVAVCLEGDSVFLDARIDYQLP